MSEVTIRRELPPLPARMKDLPLDHRGYPVPWFVAKIDGVYDFRVIRTGGIEHAYLFENCWVCGQTLGAWITFVLGPMCAVNRTTAEPPCHRECAEWSAIACPFLARPHAHRRDNALPEGAVEPGGIMLRRNPGVALCWHTKRANIRRKHGVLFDIGDPYETTWFAEGRPATHDEIMESINSGLPSLQELAEAQGPRGVKQLDKQLRKALTLVPATGYVGDPKVRR